MLGLLAAVSVAFLMSSVGTGRLIELLRARGFVQPIHESVTQHALKAGTPTMGGIALTLIAPVAYLAGTTAVGAHPGGAGLTLLVGIIAGGVVGAVDDWLKVTRGRNTLGLRERQKSVLILLVAGLVIATSGSNACHSPSLARCGPAPDIGVWPWASWVLAVIWLTTNAVNFTDGGDGLLIGCSVPPLTLLAAIAYWQHRHPAIYDTQDALEIAIVLTAMVGGCLGLLWWNAAPAQVFIGETGSLAVGAAIAIAALRLNVELLIPVFGVVYVVEGASSFAQRMWCKGTRRFRSDHQPRRLFRMAPLHHHFELVGWPETHVVFRFWILSACGSALAGAIFYADAVEATSSVDEQPPPPGVEIDDRLTVVDSSIHGRGLFFSTDIPSGTVVLRLGGRLVATPELRALIAAADRDPGVPFVDTSTVHPGRHPVLPPGSPAHAGSSALAGRTPAGATPGRPGRGPAAGSGSRGRRPPGRGVSMRPTPPPPVGPLASAPFVPLARPGPRRLAAARVPTAPVGSARTSRGGGGAGCTAGRLRGRRARLEQLVDQDLRQPRLVALGLPTAIDDEEPIQLGREEGMDDVGGLSLPDPGTERAGARQRLRDQALAGLALGGDGVEERRGSSVDVGRAQEDAVERCGLHVHLDDDGDEPGELPLRVGLGEERSDLRSIRHLDVLVVAGDGHVEEGLEDAVLRREQAVHGGQRDIGELADRLDGRRSVAPLEELAASSIHDGGSGQARPRLVRARSG